MQDFSFTLPIQVYFGKTSLKKVPEVLKSSGKRCLFLYGREHVKKTGLYEKIYTYFREAGLEVAELSGIKPNPTLTKVHEGIGLARKFKPDFLFALGGGSVIDTAKAIACGHFYSGELWDFFEKKAKPERALPLFVVPTIAGSGSELNDVSVIVNEELGLKLSMRHPSLLPKVAFLDPSLTSTVPPNLTAYGVFDAFSHSFEFYHFSKNHSEAFPFDLAVLFMKKLLYWGKVALKEPADYQARANLLWISSLALSGLLRCGVGNYRFFLHSLEHPLSGLFDLPHGLNLAILMLAYLRLYHRSQRVRKFFKKVFALEGETDLSKRGLSELVKLYQEFQIPLSLREVGLKLDDLPLAVERACQILYLWKAEEEFTREEVQKIYQAAWDGP